MDIKEKISLVNKLRGEILEEVATKLNEALKFADDAKIRVIDENDRSFYLESFSIGEDRDGNDVVQFETREE